MKGVTHNIEKIIIQPCSWPQLCVGLKCLPALCFGFPPVLVQSHWKTHRKCKHHCTQIIACNIHHHWVVLSVYFVSLATEMAQKNIYKSIMWYFLKREFEIIESSTFKWWYQPMTFLSFSIFGKPHLQFSHVSSAFISFYSMNFPPRPLLSLPLLFGP